MTTTTHNEGERCGCGHPRVKHWHGRGLCMHTDFYSACKCRRFKAERCEWSGVRKSRCSHCRTASDANATPNSISSTEDR